MVDCLFCKIIAGEVPSKPAATSERAYAFYDIAPQAPVHVLIIPKEHITSADDVTSEHEGIVDEMVVLGQQVAEMEGVRTSGYRLVMNIGIDGQMTVGHLHIHLLGGRRMERPPG